MRVKAQEDDFAAEFFCQFGHACLFAGAFMSPMPVFVALAADDESWGAEDKVWSALGASPKRLQGLVSAHGGHGKVVCHVVGPLQLDARLFACGFTVAGFADMDAVEWDAGVSFSKAGVAGMSALIVHEFSVCPQMIGARKGFGAERAGEGERASMDGECMAEEVVGAREGFGAAGAVIGPAASVLGGEVSLEVVFPPCPIGTLGALHEHKGT